MTSNCTDLQTIAVINRLSREINTIAASKGWWNSHRSDGELIALMHAELSEALEAARAGDPPDDHIPEFTGMEAEFADAIIRILDTAAHKGLRVAEAIVAKMKFNSTREYRHGKKF